MADLAKLKPSERFIDIKHPATDANIGVRVSVMSLDDDRLKKIKRQIQDERIRLERKNKGFNAEKTEDNTNLILFSAMVDWQWGKDDDGEQATFNGATPSFNQSSVVQVLTELPWFADQIAEAVGETKAFFQK